MSAPEGDLGGPWRFNQQAEKMDERKPLQPPRRALTGTEGFTYRFGSIRDETHAEIPRFVEIRFLRGEVTPGMLFAIATDAWRPWRHGRVPNGCHGSGPVNGVPGLRVAETDQRIGDWRLEDTNTVL